MFGVLDRYIGKTIFNTIMATLFMLVSLSGIIKFVDQLRKTGEANTPRWVRALYAAQRAERYRNLLPDGRAAWRAVRLGTLAQRSELVVMQASGFTRLQIAASVMKTAIPLVLLTMAIGEFVAPQGEQMARNYRAQQLVGGSLLSTQNGLWAKDGNNFIFIERIKDNSALSGISIYSFNDQRRLQTVRYAASATYNVEKKRGICQKWMNPT